MRGLETRRDRRAGPKDLKKRGHRHREERGAESRVGRDRDRDRERRPLARAPLTSWNSACPASPVADAGGRGGPGAGGRSRHTASSPAHAMARCARWLAGAVTPSRRTPPLPPRTGWGWGARSLALARAPPRPAPPPRRSPALLRASVSQFQQQVFARAPEGAATAKQVIPKGSLPARASEANGLDKCKTRGPQLWALALCQVGMTVDPPPAQAV